MLKKLPPQTQEVLKLLQARGSTTQLEAGGVLRVRSLTKRISELRKAGYSIISERKQDHTGQRYVRYLYKGQQKDSTLHA